jgi:ppGpp synthetase/RelA/SpoT-type nucleotidyltranferase
VSAIEEARQRWVAERPRYQQFGRLIEARLRESLKPVGIWYVVEARAKTVDSLVKKLLTKQHHTFDSLPDKVGARIVIRYRADIDKVVERVRKLFDSDDPEDKQRLLGTDRVGYLSVHLDKVRLHQKDDAAKEYPPDTFFVELQVRTLAQHLWSEMSHDSVYKNEEMIAKLDPEIRRRVSLMAGQIEVADREFDRLNRELMELSFEVLNTLLPLIPKDDVGAFSNRLNEFLEKQHGVIEKVYAKARELGAEDDTTPAFLYQPEVLLVYNLLTDARDNTRKIWNEHYPDRELERIANSFGISLD